MRCPAAVPAGAAGWLARARHLQQRRLGALRARGIAGHRASYMRVCRMRAGIAIVSSGL